MEWLISNSDNYIYNETIMFKNSDSSQSNVNLGMYQEFTNLFILNNSKTKKNIEIEFKSFIPSKKDALNLYETSYLSLAAYNSFEKFVGRNIDTLNNNSLYQENYKFLGQSPRIQVEFMGLHVTSIKGGVRNEIFRKMNVWNKDYVYVDVDLKSAFATICVGKYPQFFKKNSEALNTGLWNYIRKTTFGDDMNSFDKKNVKICVYSSYFGGTYKSFVHGILEKKRKDLGLTPYEWRQLPNRELYLFRKQADYIAKKMMNSDLLLESRAASHLIYNLYENSTLISPTGHEYNINKNTYWNSIFSMYLQSLEQYLVQNTCIIMSKYYKYEEIIFIASFHDGFIVRIEKSKKLEIYSNFNKALKNLSESLNLKREVSFEFKEF